ncbi:MAG: ABC transporter ATP-binding protein [Pseudomonadota bacterium]|nr:ABC transporter ATP-binding protein [Pseudomonadota bacterium]
MVNPILSVKNLSKTFGALRATDNLSLDVRENEIHAIIGPNGAGKTTLIAQLSGMLRPDEGNVYFEGQEISNMSASAICHVGIARSFQITSILKDFSVLDNVSLPIQAQQGHSFRFWKPYQGDPELYKPARKILEEVGLGDRADVIAGNLSHGEQRRLEIAVALATSPKLLLLDEPMAGMDSEASAEMVDYLRTLKGRYTILLIEHDMGAVFALADRITVLVYGKSIACGSPGEIRDNKDVRAAYLGTDE